MLSYVLLLTSQRLFHVANLLHDELSELTLIALASSCHYLNITDQHGILYTVSALLTEKICSRDILCQSIELHPQYHVLPDAGQ